MTSGVYAIRHSSGASYVGSSVNIENRWSVHLWQLRHSRHTSPLAQELWLKTDESEWSLVILEECGKEDLRRQEQVHMDREPSLLNLIKKSDGRGRVTTEETRARQRAGRKRYLSDPEARKQLSDRAREQHAKGLLGSKTWVNGPDYQSKPFVEQREKAVKTMVDRNRSAGSEEMRRRSLMRKNIKQPAE